MAKANPFLKQTIAFEMAHGWVFWTWKVGTRQLVDEKPCTDPVLKHLDRKRG